MITSTELPDVEVTAPAAVVAGDAMEPLPAAHTTDILGLLEYLDTQAGACDLFQVAQDTHGTFVEVLTTVKGAEMLDLVDTPQRLGAADPGRSEVRAGGHGGAQAPLGGPSSSSWVSSVP